MMEDKNDKNRKVGRKLNIFLKIHKLLRNSMTRPHFPASNGCSFSKPKKLML